jgi:hypothetical protein
MHSHHHIFQYRQIVEKLRLLKSPVNPQGRNLVSLEAGNRSPLEEDFPGIQGINAGDGVQQGGFPRSVGPDEGKNPTRVDGKEPVQPFQPAKAGLFLASTTVILFSSNN